MPEQDIKITFSPIQELIVHEIVEVNKDDLLRERITPNGNMPLCWCNGIIFSFSSLPLTDEVSKDYLKGRIHWMEVHFSKMPSYSQMLTLSDEEYKTTMNIRVIDTSKSELHRKLTKWISSKKG